MRIRELRQARGLYQSQVADAVGVSVVSVSKWETGICQPSADKLPLLAAALGCTIDAIYGREPPGRDEDAAAS